MWRLHFLRFYISIILINMTKGDDPCTAGNFKYLHSAGLRGSSCNKKSGKEVCDRYIYSGWYKVLHEDDRTPRQMLTGPVELNRCGTTYPVWLNGSHPKLSQDIVNRTACMSGLTSFCDQTFNIQIKLCTGGDFVYNLQRLPTCFIGYCFGDNRPCAEPNPCESGNSVLMQVKGDRSLSCSDETLTYCDNTLKETWYKVTAQGQPLKMPTTCVRQNHCGTQLPIWMNGSEPSVAEKVVIRKACVTNGNACTCRKSYDIHVRNCTNFLVYKLKSTSVCPERYCFGTEGNCFEEKDKASDDSAKYLYWLFAAVPLAAFSSAACYIWMKKTNRIQTPQADQRKKREKEVGGQEFSQKQYLP